MKRICFILMSLLCIGLIPQTASAQEIQVRGTTSIAVNNVDDAADYVHEQLVQNMQKVELLYEGDLQEKQIQQIKDKATGDWDLSIDRRDDIRLNVVYISCEAKVVTSNQTLLTFYVNYKTTYTKDIVKKMNEEIQSIIFKLDIKHADEITKITKIHQYLATNIAYDDIDVWDNDVKRVFLEKKGSQKAICLAMSMLLDAVNIDNRIVTTINYSYLNIVKVNNRYYYDDPGISAQYVSMGRSDLIEEYFLQGESLQNEPYFQIDEPGMNLAFKDKYPIYEANYKNPNFSDTKFNIIPRSEQYTALDGTTLNANINGKIIMRVYYKYDCPLSRSYLQELNSSSLLNNKDIYIVPVEITRADRNEVSKMRDELSLTNLNLGYDVSSHANNNMWYYIHQTMTTNSVTLPIVVLSNRSGMVQYVVKSATLDQVKKLVYKIYQEEGLSAIPPKIKGFKRNSNSSITLNWNSSPNASSYVIYRSTKENNLFYEIGTSDITSFTDTQYNYKNTYQYRIVAVKDNIKGKHGDAYLVQSPYTPVSKLTINPSNATLSIGKSFQAKAMIYPKNSTDQQIRWRSGNNNVISVNKNGIVKAVGAGKTYLYAKHADGFETKALVEVLPNVASVAINPSNVTIGAGKTFQVKAIVSPSNASNVVTWKSTSPTIAKVDQKGNITAIKAGYSYIIATTSNGKKAKSLVKVVEVKPNRVSMNLSNATLSIGKTFNAKATVYPTNATNKNITWSSGNTNVVKVDAYGKVTTVGAGTTYVYAKTSNGITGKILVKVLPNPTGVAITPKSATVRIGATFKTKAIVTPSNATSSVTFKSSSPSIATVDSSGNVKAIKAGYTYISVTTANGKTAKFLLRVI